MIKQLLSRHNSLAAVYFNARLRLAGWRGGAPLIVYQVGKVGSTTVVASLKALKLGRPIYHIHTLLQDRLDASELYYRQIYQHNPTADYARSRHLLVSRYLRRQLDQSCPGRPWQVITLVREPVARNISEFFQGIDYWLPDFAARYQANPGILNEARQIFLSQFDSDYMHTWFDDEMRPVFGLDVYAGEFPRAQGYQIYRGSRAELLVLRLESLDACAAEAFGRFLQVDDFRLVPANLTGAKQSSQAYREFLRGLVLPAAYLDRMYSTRYARHFYTDAEINRFKQRWSQ